MDLTIFQGLIIGIVQGLTEFFPVSSSGHLVIVENLLGITELNITFDTFVHLGTLLAVIVYFRKDIIQMIMALVSSIADIFRGEFKNGFTQDPYKKLVWLVLIGTIPAGVIGLTFKDVFESAFTSLYAVGAFLLVTGCILFISEKVLKSNIAKGKTIVSADLMDKEAITTNMKNINIKKVLVIGFAQALAIFPGISRSGSTLATGLLTGLNREFAAKFSFLLAIPAIFGATIVQFKDIGAGLSADLWPFVIGFISATISGYLAIDLLLKIVKGKSLNIFAIYCWIVGVLVLGLVYLGIF